MNLLIFLVFLNGIFAIKKTLNFPGDDSFMMKILHDDAIFDAFMVSGAMSRDEMNAMLRGNGIPLEVSVKLYEQLMVHWIYKILSWGIFICEIDFKYHENKNKNIYWYSFNYKIRLVVLDWVVHFRRSPTFSHWHSTIAMHWPFILAP